MVAAGERFYAKLYLRFNRARLDYLATESVVARRALLTCSLQTGMTRYRVSLQSRIRVPLSSVLPDCGGAGRPGSILTQAIDDAWQS